MSTLLDKIRVLYYNRYKPRAARTGRNPATGEDIKIAASTAVKFKVGTALKEKVNPPKTEKKAEKESKKPAKKSKKKRK